MATATAGNTSQVVRYAVVGAGWIAQSAILPAFAQTTDSRLVAIVTGDDDKAEALGARYSVKTLPYEGYDALLDSDEIDAVFVALPNAQHADYAVRALNAGKHVLLEKPMAIGVTACETINAAAQRSGARLMIAYRLHFEPATLEAIRRVRAGAIGVPRFFTATFSQHVAASNHRAQQGFWAGPVADMGPYPINAARNIFGAEPILVWAFGVQSPDGGPPLHDTVAVTLVFPEQRLAQFTVSYSAQRVDEYEIVGSSGALRLSPGFDFESGLHLTTLQGESTREEQFPATDQFAGELSYFTRCILDERPPEPDGLEGLADVRVIAAIERSLLSGTSQVLDPLDVPMRPQPAQVMRMPPNAGAELVDATEPGQG
ncbi:Gfo/Idh/MocA family protein [Uliginosibacterium sp. H1]|uniref:Gfo/Idh/MocA family protein n=1 Tax=Uliginosibacterium sp. H1 TaxID=3114757 RepID=UPI002E17DC1C|nr:Gfo/Idh/MocA family oxidoreductase [Uliginosibacterium sp. H1]